jgi:prevent-host-death family protein
MTTVNVHEAKTHLSRLLARVAGGEEIVIARGGTPVAKLTAVASHGARRVPGALKGRMRLADDIDAPLPADELAAWEGGAESGDG